MNIDVLKMDKGFLGRQKDNKKTKAKLKNIINMPKNLKIRVIQEGEKTFQKLPLLKNKGV